MTWLTGYPALAEKIRLGWQVPWATQGQLVQGLKHSNIPELLDLDIEYVGFAYGGPLNKAALGGGVDVLLTADHPAAVLLSKQRGFKIVARMMYNRVCLYTPNGSDITELGQLAGARVAGPIGAAAERVALAEIRDAGIDLSSVSLAQLDMSQQNALIISGRDWTGIDAMFGFDPLPAIWSANGQIEILKCGPVVSIVAASEQMVTDRREELEAFLTAFHLSWETFRQNPEPLGKLFLEEARLDAKMEALDQAASIEL
jgi:ABC-type nitrate/sulfonate/bicarbonate transport system substrate-binding protein